jgi:predicted ATPase/transcriptional regulator with XRE-family HTH domain
MVYTNICTKTCTKRCAIFVSLLFAAASDGGWVLSVSKKHRAGSSPPFGHWLSHQRKARDLTQEDLAERLGCSVWSIQKIEVGNRRPSRQVAELMADFFAIPTAQRPDFLLFARGQADAWEESSSEQPSAPTVPLPSSIDERLANSRPSSANNLPTQLTSFVGRPVELPRILDLLLTSGVRLLTLTGPPGTGKTRLALQVATELLKDFEDGVFFVNLAPISDPGLVVPEIAQSLALGRSGANPILDAVEGYVRDRRLLLVLDNFEQVVEAAPHVAELLMKAPRLKVLATSRAPLQVRGEKEFSVPTLQLPDTEHLPPLNRLSRFEAVRLFIQRATDVSTDFEMTADNASAVAQICARLDGLPLAIELAAARVKVLSPQAILTRLESRLDLLTGGPRDLPPRQRTLRSAIEWSYDLLDEDEKKLFSRLGVFQGGRSLEAIEAICSADGNNVPDMHMLDMVSSLVNKGLLRREEGVDGALRFTMLETIHEYAREKLDESGEGEDIRRLYALYFVDFAEQAEQHLINTEQTVWIDRLDAELGNFRAVLGWSQSAEGDPNLGLRMATALGRFWNTRSYVQEGREWLSVVLSRVDAQERTPPVGRALMWAGWLAYFQSEYGKARELLVESLTIFREQGSKQDIAYTLDGLGEIAYYEGNFELAIACFEEWLAISREVGDIGGITESLLFLGYAEWRLVESGNYDLPNARLNEALALIRQVGNAYRLAEALRMVGEIRVRQGDYGQASGLLQESLAISQEQGTKWGIAASLGTLGWLALCEGDYERARQLLRESILTRQEIGDKGGMAWCLEWLAVTTITEWEVGGQEAHIAHAARAARIFGAAQILRRNIGAITDPADRPEYERNIELLRLRLSAEEFDNAWQEGQALSVQQAIAYALKEK